jgi:hypothetical protein
MVERKFGRLRQFDERSRNFPVRKLIKQEVPITKLWDCSKVLDQGSEPACVGFAGAHQAVATPIPQIGITNDTGMMFYKGAQQHDEWPGDDYEGSSGLGLFKYFKNIGFCTSGYWAFNLLEHRLGISYVCPALVGSNWMTGMMDVDSEGFIHATGISEGGHETLYIGTWEEERYFTIQNSWGSGWGVNGRAKISFDDVEKLRSSMDVLFIQDERTDWQPAPPEPEPSDCEFSNAVADLLNSVWKATGKKTRFKTTVERR